jgi:nucleotide-binding universal stress UspA family protein
MEIARILWPTDFSDAAATAERYVISLSRKYNAEVHLVHVADDLSQYEHYWGSGPSPQHVDELREYALRVSREHLDHLCKSRLTGCPRYVMHVVLGNPAREILRLIDEINPDLVIMATRGMKDVFPFGSVAERVIKSSPVPVLTINPETRRIG